MSFLQLHAQTCCHWILLVKRVDGLLQPPHPGARVCERIAWANSGSIGNLGWTCLVSSPFLEIDLVRSL